MQDSNFKDLQCPQCGNMMELQFSNKFRLKNGSRKPFYRCVDYPQCDGSHGAHPNGAPMGTPADAMTRRWRIAAHAALNRVFQWSKKRGREATYRWLEEKGFGHISNMSEDQCKKIVTLADKEYLSRYNIHK